MRPFDILRARHSFAHLLAASVQKLYPKVTLGIGPVIENGFYYDFGNLKITDADLSRIEKEMREIAKQNLAFKKELWTSQKASAHYKKLKQPFKLELIKDLLKTKNQKLKTGKVGMVYTGDVFLDLCRGGHVKNTKELPLDAFKLTHIAGAYWRGSEKNPMLTRIYGAAFATKKELATHLWQLEEAKKRDHRVWGEKLKLFTFAPEVGPGLPLWLPNGTILRDEIENYAKQVEKEWGYQRVTTPHIAKDTLYKTSGHLPYYKDSMFPPMELDDGTYYLKAMNCPHTHLIYRAEPRSWRDLPLRFAEYGTVYRYERSGTLAGLLRVRGMTQNDAHIYCTEDQVEEEFLKVMKLHEFWYNKVFGIKDFYMRLSLPAKDKAKYVADPKGWKKAVDIVQSAMKKSGMPFEVAEGEAAFYGPKVDFQIKSAIGREESASTNQLDFIASKRFNLTYKDKDGKDKPVYVIHRAPLGSHERFIAFLIEHYAGSFPLWLSPEQVWIIPVSEKAHDYAKQVKEALKNARVILKDENETMGKKIRQGELLRIPYLLIVGEKEAAANTVSVRERGKGDIGQMQLPEFQKKVGTELEERI
ncbi:MAG: threonine--tRNA ligase [Candidatus Wildermuthbacteria bacterium RIFCSPHIGHO2_01_FULL_48_25]|uniref:Threonine--tRNA ligase n=1 Tax=Candidatus Wildermuthbacteria bacterium RIFCSPLOWO2_01_FULL_48_16 TaxID=1802461 RepID=A0A1G2RKT7_9BACT|nr:MAG: threonine--tRNA ligase [Candidatus Wildermuthbacteria bacterium RIFCSPHIGHO2_01_FULL_48_25]OHA69427.1 MAG: threonine--tRNA ligase [Candidatus Wildermuthbacteria bacterium RIFCSPHIGHO2_02_FULL_49_12b]OHA73460.1 MAG: threonine--tRNA ligase [Candidatus Wildermuthbacteria bacterium RIFCSPLOWO2_01_FULL_48_16]